jgi:hypothetical protein
MDFPNDADGDALRQLMRIGCDLSRPMTIEFAVDVPDEAAGREVAKVAAGAGYRTELMYDEGEETDDGDQGYESSWTCYCFRDMIVTYEAVVAAQEELSRLSQPHGGWCDSWGSFGNAAE